MADVESSQHFSKDIVTQLSQFPTAFGLGMPTDPQYLTPDFCLNKITSECENHNFRQKRSFQDAIDLLNEISGYDQMRWNIIQMCNMILNDTLETNNNVINLSKLLNGLHMEKNKKEIEKNDNLKSDEQETIISKVKTEPSTSCIVTEQDNTNISGNQASPKIKLNLKNIRQRKLKLSKKRKSVKPNLRNTKKLITRSMIRNLRNDEDSNEEGDDDVDDTLNDATIKNIDTGQDPDSGTSDVNVTFEEEDNDDTSDPGKDLEFDSNQVVTDLNSRRHYKLSDTNTRPHKCHLCSRRFCFPGSLTKHLQEYDHNVSESTKCPVCPKTYGRLSDLSNHINNSHKTYKQPHVCNICNKSFHFQKSLKAHHISVHHRLQNQCQDCHRRFETKGELSEHQKLHPSDGTFGCSVCKIKQPSRSLLVKHEKTHMPEKCFKCRECGTSFKNSSTLVGHMRTHTGEKPYVCELCGNSYAQMSTLKVHQLTHSNTKAHACEHCDYAFRTKAELNNHTLVHTKEKKFQCDECGKRFPRVRSLRDHLLTHAGIKPYNCKQCSQKFSCHQHLRRHQQIHKGEMPFTCQVCGKQCRQKYNMTVHMRTHNGEKPFVCEICNKGFTYNKGLQTHKLTCGGRTSDVDSGYASYTNTSQQQPSHSVHMYNIPVYEVMNIRPLV